MLKQITAHLLPLHTFKRFALKVFVVLALLIFIAPLYTYTREHLRPTPVLAATGINHQISFQGKLVNTDGTNVTDGTYSIIFSIYTVASAGTNIWTETQTVTLSNGIFQVNLGSVTTLPASVDFNTDNIYLGIKVGADAEMTPRVQFTAVPQAFNAEKLGGLDKTGFIQNSTSLQATSNFYIQSTATNSVTAKLRALTGQSADVIQVRDSTDTSTVFSVSPSGAVTAVGVNSGTGLLQGTGGLTITGTSSLAATTISSTLGVTGTSTFTGLGTFNGGLTVANNSNFSQTGTGTFSTGSGAVTLNGATSVTGTNTFNVGTGASVFGGTLQYATGTSNTATQVCRNASGQLAGCNTTGTGAVFTQGGNSFGATAVLGTNDANDLQLITGGTPKLTVQNSTGNVGIGTTTPTEKLHVYNGNEQIDFGNLKFGTVTAPGAPTVAASATAGVLTGNYRYGITYVTAQGETSLGTASAVVSPAAKQVNLTAIPLGTSGVVTARKIYRTLAGGATYYYVATLNDNVTTTYTDNTADGSLTVVANVINTTGGRTFLNGGQTSVYDPTGANTANGYVALAANTSGIYNTADGYAALQANTTGIYNTATGALALNANSTGNFNVASGMQALGSNTTGTGNISSGFWSLLYNKTGNYNVAVGYAAGQGAPNSSDIIGNSLFGTNTGNALLTGGNYNTLLGYGAGTLVTTGANNTFVGYNAGANVTTGSNNIIIGQAVNATSVSASNKLNIGNAIYGDLSTGNIGIGVTAPNAKFQVAGNSYFQGDISTTGLSGIQSQANNFNVSPNSSFEVKANSAGTDPDGWITTASPGGGTASTVRASDAQSDGTYSIKSVLTGASTSISEFTSASYIPIKPSTNYYHAIDIKNDAAANACGATIYIRALWYTSALAAASTPYNDSYTAGTTTTTWTAYGGTVTSPSNASFAKLEYYSFLPTGSCTRWFDNSVFRQVSFAGDLNLTSNLSVTGNTSFLKGTDYSTVGVTNNVAFSAGSLIRLTGASTQTITGIAGGTDGRTLTLVNAAGQAAVLNNNDTVNSSAGNYIITGTGANLSMPAGSSAQLVYDAGASVWRLVGVSGACATCANQQLSNLSGTVAINTALLTAGDNLIDLGSAANSFRTLYADTSVLTSTLDIATAGTLSFGNSTATAITLGKAGITTTNPGALTVSQILTGNLGITINGAAANLNVSSNFNTNINTGSSTGTVTIGNTLAGAISLQTASTIGIANGTTGTAITVGNTTSNPTIAFNGSGTFGTTTGAVSLNGTTTVAANKDVVITTGTGVFSQTFSGTTQTPHTITSTFAPSGGGIQTNFKLLVTNSPTVTANTLYGQSISLTETSNLATTIQGQRIRFTDAGTGTGTKTGLDIDVTTANPNDTTYAALFSGGNVGINSTSPQAKLQINGSADPGGEYGTLALQSTGNSGKRTLLGYSDTLDAGYIDVVHSGVAWKSLLLNSYGGNVGIGVTAATSTLHVVGQNGGAGTAAPSVLNIQGGSGGSGSAGTGGVDAFNAGNGTNGNAGGAGSVLTLTSGAGAAGGAGGSGGTGQCGCAPGNGETGGNGGNGGNGANGGNITIQTGAGGAGGAAGGGGGVSSVYGTPGANGSAGSAGTYGKLILQANGGNVGIGTSNPTNKLGVAGNIAASGSITQFGSPDYAENITASDSSIEAADVVSLDPANKEHIVKSVSPYETRLVGVISTNPGFLTNGQLADIDSTVARDKLQRPLALSGRVPVKVTNENGSIKAGDYLTSSTTPGYAMKATKPGPTIGKAMEDFNGTTGKIIVFISTSYADPVDHTLQAASSFDNINVAGETKTASLVVTGTTTTKDLTVTGTATIQTLVVTTSISTKDINVVGIATLAELKVTGDATVQNLYVGGKLISKGAQPTVATGQALTGVLGANVTVGGTDTAGTVAINSGTQVSSAGILAEVTFSSNYATPPKIVISGNNGQSAKIGAYIERTATGFKIKTDDPLAQNTVYEFDYIIISAQNN